MLLQEFMLALQLFILGEECLVLDFCEVPNQWTSWTARFSGLKLHQSVQRF